MAYIRRGECKRCGDCCQFYADQADGTDLDWNWFAALHGFKSVGLRESGSPVYARLTKCLLCRPGPVVYACKEYESGHRPQLCKQFPETPDDLVGLPDCGFYFEEGED